MAGRGAPPKAPEDRRGAHVPQRGDWHATPGVGWQHGPIPRPALSSRKMSAPALDAWTTWMESWFAANWGPEDLPGLRITIALYAKVAGGKVTASERGELRQLMDNYGITKKGQQDRRWSPPKIEEPASRPGDAPGDGAPVSIYGHLRSVAGDAR